MATPIKLPRMHELIAVRNNLKTQATKTTADLINTLEKKQHHFGAKIKEFTPSGEGTVSKVEEQLDLQTTVLKELDWLRPFVAKAIDISLQVSRGNTSAFGEVLVDTGDSAPLSLFDDALPATTLLELEDTIESLRKLANAIPTLDPAKGFRPDPAKGEGVYQARTVEKTRTQAKKTIYTLAPPTDKHPAQVQLIDEQVPIGTIRETEWSSMLTPADKGRILERLDNLGRAIRKARARANETEVVASAKIGDKLFSYIFGV